MWFCCTLPAYRKGADEHKDICRLTLQRQCLHFSWILRVAEAQSSQKNSLKLPERFESHHLFSQWLWFEGLMPKLYLNFRPNSIHLSKGCSVPKSPPVIETLEVFNVCKVAQKHSCGQAVDFMSLCTCAALSAKGKVSFLAQNNFQTAIRKSILKSIRQGMAWSYDRSLE